MFHSPSAVVVVVRRRARRRVATALALIGAALLFGVTYAGGLAALTGYVLFVVGVITLVRDRTEPVLLNRSRGHAGSVTVDDDSLHLAIGQRQLALPLDALVQGWTAPGTWGVRAFVETRDGDVYAIEIANEAEASALLDAAGVSADKRIVTTRLGPPTQRPALGCATLIVAAVAALFFGSVLLPLLGVVGDVRTRHLVILGVLTLVALALGEISVPPILTIGLDGLQIRTFFRRRFIALADIVGSTDTQGGVTLELQDGRSVRLEALQRAPQKDAVAVLRTMVARALAASQKTRSPSRAAEALGRRGEKLADWITRVKKLGGSASYREGNLGADALAEVMLDAQAPADRRLGAAISLAELGGDAGRARVRIAAGATADADLRAALEAAAEKELTEAIAERALRRMRDG